ncbi:hypothetical protein TOPH_04962 [Tolypocladium ophioglossoides CBS 100239]|uniref:Zinc finger PHD-type domain-containing protein n=1 Tax=Tolypocladium ophioglossoides (strain CBS 100239) TaxID=1163406 RepID=A0A0L0N8N9_TOLOC|nr:hypothetical protein TOPH_04962 [Tolypocladium ophioglossoides CBS 100239]
MPSRKRSIQSVDGGGRDAAPTLLHRLRNTWQFANVCQWIYMFGKAAKIDDSIDVDVRISRVPAYPVSLSPARLMLAPVLAAANALAQDIEAECLKPNSTLLSDLALAILKLVSSHRGLTHDIFDDQMRKQYLTKAPDSNPFGDDDDPHKFAEFDVFAKIKVLQRLTQWTMIHPERIRDKVEEQKDTEQASWRIEPYGWDREDRTYFVLDDNRVYRLTEPPLAPPRPKPKKSKPFRGGRRSSKRQRTMPSTSDLAADIAAEGDGEVEPVDNGLGGRVWECVAVTLQEVQDFLEGLGKTRDDNEKILRRQLQTHLVPILEKQEESRKRKQVQRERELLNLAKMANAKRSSRIAGKVERQKQEDKEKEEEHQRRETDAAKRREEQEHLKLEKERDFRLFSRQRRLQEREARRLQHEEELAQLSEDSKAASSTTGRISERRLQAEMERNRQALKDLEQEEEDWVFDCACGLYGQVDDGTHSVACEKCNVWQHSKCLGVSEEEADRPAFHFVCSPCKRRDEVAKPPPRSIIKLKLNPTGSSGVHHKPADNPSMPLSTRPPAADDGGSTQPIERAHFAAQAYLPKGSPSHSATVAWQYVSPISTTPSFPKACEASESADQSVRIPPIHQNGNAEASRATEGQEVQLTLSMAGIRGDDTTISISQPGQVPRVGSTDVTTAIEGITLLTGSPLTIASAHIDSSGQGRNSDALVDAAPGPTHATHDAQKASNNLGETFSSGSNLTHTTTTAGS